jgi:hypothetical protein
MARTLTIPKGTEITAYIAADTPLVFRKLQQATSYQRVRSSEDRSGSDGPIFSNSSIDAARRRDYVDEKFLGTTPSTVLLTPGEHKIVIMKTGFKSWERTMTISPNGSVNLDVSLEKAP